jgi:hypothetical protein
MEYNAIEESGTSSKQATPKPGLNAEEGKKTSKHPSLIPQRPKREDKCNASKVAKVGASA